MAVVQIPNLPVAIALNGNEQLEIVQSGQSKRTSVQSIADLGVTVTTSAIYANIDILKLTPIQTTTPVFVEGYYNPGDGGGGYFYGVTGAAPGTYVNNDGTIIVQTGGDGSSAWIRFKEVATNVKYFGAVGNGITDDTLSFTNAASLGTTVYIPKGNYLISSTTAYGFWYLEEGAVIDGLPNINGINDTSRLTGRCFNIVNSTNEGIRIGSTDPWLEKLRTSTIRISEMSCTSGDGLIGFIAGSRTSDNLTPNFACIGIAGYCQNNNTVNPEPAWATYFEARRSNGAGAAYCSEMDFVNNGNTFDLTPYTSINATTGQTSNLWLSCGGGDAALGGNSNSAAITILPNPAEYRRGIIFRYNALDGITNEAITMAVGHRLSWYNTANQLNSYIDHINISQYIEADVASGINIAASKKRGGGAATILLDTICRNNYFGCSGGGNSYQAGYTQLLQRSNFSAGDARFSFDIGVLNSDGTTSSVTLNGVTEKAFTPATDNFLSLGSGSFRWSVVFAATGTINTSDEADKTEIQNISEKEKNVAIDIKSKIKSFKYADSVAKKKEKARIHFGVIAQNVKSAFEKEGLDADNYGIFCSDTWTDEDGVSKTRLGIRYDELFSFILSSL